MKTTTFEATTTGTFGCWKCGGTGIVEWARHYAAGVCFACKGAGEAPSGAIAENGVHTFQVGELVWQFSPATECENLDGVLIRNARPGETVHRVYLQCFRVGANRRSGVTLLRACTRDIEAARNVWRAAEAGKRPEDVTLAELGIPADQRCAWSRNRRGIEPL